MKDSDRHALLNAIKNHTPTAGVDSAPFGYKLSIQVITASGEVVLYEKELLNKYSDPQVDEFNTPASGEMEVTDNIIADLTGSGQLKGIYLIAEAVGTSDYSGDVFSEKVYTPTYADGDILRLNDMSISID